MNNQFVFLVSGPTGVGKSDFVIKLAEQLDYKVEIINADIGSFYTQLSIGTAKPDWKNSKIPHHFFDILDQPVNWTIQEFRQQLAKLIQEIWQRGNIPVVVGGSAFYVKSFFYKNYELATPDPILLQRLEMQPTENLWKELVSIDPDRAAEIDCHDQYRLVRALAIWHTEKQKPSEFKQIFDPLAPFYCITLTRDRDQLYSIINNRVDTMLQTGWLDEVKALSDDQAWVTFLHKKKMIGYNELLGYVQGQFAEQDFNDLVALIAQRTRNYAKRQLTFLKKLQQEVLRDSKGVEEIKLVQEFNLSKVVVADVIKEIVQNIIHL
ncbi:MAG: tRNA (adenosine(37)-N6)-dimethylallyltransferase MiaA [Candidatus Chromulinivorax sp.]